MSILVCTSISCPDDMHPFRPMVFPWSYTARIFNAQKRQLSQTPVNSLAMLSSRIYNAACICNGEPCNLDVAEQRM